MNLTLLPENGYFTSVRKLIADSIFPEGKEMRNSAERAANIDHLTKLANRRALELALPTVEANSEMALILFDANNFGQVNKVLSHSTGDTVLRRMADVIKAVANRYGLAERCFRMGGDEFVVICPRLMAQTIRSQVENSFEPYILPTGTLVTLSGTTGSTLAEADEKLQTRKKSQKTNYTMAAYAHAAAQPTA